MNKQIFNLCVIILKTVTKFIFKMIAMPTKPNLPTKTTHGGARAGAGAKTKEPTIVTRVPLKLLQTINNLIDCYKGALPAETLVFAPNNIKKTIPLAQDRVRAGFPSPAEPYIASQLDFNDYLVQNADATIGIFAGGDSMIDAGIGEGDLLVVNRAAKAKHNDIVVANIDNNFTVKRLVVTSTGIEFHAECAAGTYPIIRPMDGSEVTLIGVVTHCIKKL